VDEFQDINASQWLMIERMLHPGAKLIVVGDDAQNI
jgi:superfamily I DNA/RNA helicase